MAKGGNFLQGLFLLSRKAGPGEQDASKLAGNWFNLPWRVLTPPQTPRPGGREMERLEEKTGICLGEGGSPTGAPPLQEPELSFACESPPGLCVVSFEALGGGGQDIEQPLEDL